MSASRKTILLRAFLVFWFVAGWAITIAVVELGMRRGDLGTTIRGRIVDRESGRPIPGVLVVGTSGAPIQFILTRDQARTNQSGIFELKVSPTRPTELRADAKRYLPTGFYLDPMQADFVELKMGRAG